MSKNTTEMDDEVKYTLKLLHIAQLFDSVAALRQAVGDQKHELIAMYLNKTIANFERVEKDGTVEEFQKIKEGMLS